MKKVFILSLGYIRSLEFSGVYESKEGAIQAAHDHAKANNFPPLSTDDNYKLHNFGATDGRVLDGRSVDYIIRETDLKP